MESFILETLIYADIFDYPLTGEEIHKRLHKKEATLEEVTSSLNKLLNKGKVKKQKGYYFLPGRESIVRLRKKRNKISQRKEEKAQKTAQLLKLVPSVKLVGLTGSVAAGNAEDNDDLDFLIITSSNWLWTTRFLTTALFTILGLRRRPEDKRYKDKVCLNLFLEQGHLNRFVKEKNLFLAYEIILMQPLWFRNEIHNKFLIANSWIRNYLPNSFKNLRNLNLQVNYSARSTTIVDNIIRFIDLVFFGFQKWWMGKRKTTEKVEAHLIAFHPRDLNKPVLMEYNRRLKEI